MDKPIMDFNMSIYDRINRLGMGSWLLIAMMLSDGVPAWFILIPLYPILTAIAVWDPVYALFNLTRKLVADKLSLKEGKLVLE